MARPPYHIEAKETIPCGEAIVVTDRDHNLTDSLIQWNGITFTVDKDYEDLLTTFEDHS